MAGREDGASVRRARLAADPWPVVPRRCAARPRCRCAADDERAVRRVGTGPGAPPAWAVARAHVMARSVGRGYTCGRPPARDGVDLRIRRCRTVIGKSAENLQGRFWRPL